MTRKLSSHAPPEHFVATKASGRRVVRVALQDVGEPKPKFDPDREAEKLYKECQRLLRQIARNRLNLKMLQAALTGLTVISQYKANRH